MLCVAAPAYFPLIKLMARVHSWYRTRANKGLGRTQGTFNSRINENHLYPPPPNCLRISFSRSQAGMGRGAGDGEIGKRVWFPAPSWAAQPACAEGGGTQAWRHMSSLLSMTNEEKCGGTQALKDEMILVWADLWGWGEVDWFPLFQRLGWRGEETKAGFSEPALQLLAEISLVTPLGEATRPPLCPTVWTVTGIREFHEPLHKAAVKCTHSYLPRVSSFNAHFV